MLLRYWIVMVERSPDHLATLVFIASTSSGLITVTNTVLAFGVSANLTFMKPKLFSHNHRQQHKYNIQCSLQKVLFLRQWSLIWKYNIRE